MRRERMRCGWGDGWWWLMEGDKGRERKEEKNLE